MAAVLGRPFPNRFLETKQREEGRRESKDKKEGREMRNKKGSGRSGASKQLPIMARV
jgi:hypothetical protein